MRKLILLLFSVFGISAAAAQNLTVTVRSDKNLPVAYAQIVVNNRAFAVTDPDGVVQIPLSRLFTGDVISVSYIGTSTEDLVFDKRVAERGFHTFTLRERSFVIDAVTVSSRDDKKLFNKYVRGLASTPARYSEMVIGGEFEYSIDDGARRITGSFTARNGRNDREFEDSTFVRSPIFKHPVQFSTMSDTTEISKYLSRDTHYLLHQSNIFLRLINNGIARAVLKTRYTYLGEDAGCRVFRLTFISMDGYPAQMLIHADTETKRVAKVELSTLSTPDDRMEDVQTAIYRNDVESVDIVLECETIKTRGAAASLFITAITGRLRWFDGGEGTSTVTELKDMKIVN